MSEPFWHKASKRWAVMVKKPDGERKMEYEKTGIARSQKTKAAVWAERVVQEARNEVRLERDLTVNDLRLLYLSWCLKRVDEEEASRHTYNGHRKQLGLICTTPRGSGTYGEIRATEFTPRVLEGLIERWEKVEIGPTTIRNRCASLMAMFSWASKVRTDRAVDRLIEANPIEGFELPKSVYRGDRCAPADEIEAFVGFVEGMARTSAEKGYKTARYDRLLWLLVRVAVESGCRPGEMCVARWEHFQPQHRAIILPPKLHKTGRKTGRKRHIMLSAALAGLIAEEAAREDRHPTHIFCHKLGSQAKARSEEELKTGVPWDSNALAKRIRAVRRDAIEAGVLKTDEGLDRMHLYRLRHTAITNAVDGGASVADVARLSGNSLKTTETRYLGHRTEHLRGVADRILGEGEAKGDGQEAAKPDGGGS